MRIGRVVGNVVSTVKHPALHGQRLLLVDEESLDGKLSHKPRLALDTVDAGEGDRVLVVDEGNSAAQALRRPRGPVRTVIVGVIDEIEDYDGATRPSSRSS